MQLLALHPASAGADRIRQAANQLTRSLTGDAGMIGAQIGLDAQACEGACSFCSFSAPHGRMSGVWIIPDEDLLRQVRELVEAGANYVSLMTTIHLPFDEYLRKSALARSVMPREMMLSANIGDFGPTQARELRSAGYGRIYHVVRLGEGVDTALAPGRRLATIAT